MSKRVLALLLLEHRTLREYDVSNKVHPIFQPIIDAIAPPAIEREHVESADCWCAPALDYVDPETGVAVYVHHEAN